jgi:spore germination protein PC
MYNNNGNYKYVAEVNRQMQALNQQIYQMNRIIQQLQNQVMNLESEVMSLKEKPATNIERIEYKFDQLKVETLEGTLNIGLTPTGDQTIDEFSVDTNQLNAPANGQKFAGPPVQQFPGLSNSLKSQANGFLDQEGNKVIETFEGKYNFPLHQQYRDFIIDDIKKQLDDRIKYHISNHSSELTNPQRIGSVEQNIFKKLKDEITRSIEAFIQNLPKGNV